MSYSDTQACSVLLPAARVGFFAKDPNTAETARAIAEDWRFARVQMDVYDGHLDEAIEIYKEKEAPNLLVVQSDTVDEEFTNKLEELSSQCEEGTNAIVVGPQNDVDLYRRLIEMGISDYLVHPTSKDDLANAMAKVLIDQLGVTGSHLIAYIGSKGGVGTSNIAQAGACLVAEVLHEKTLFLDVAGGWTVNPVGLDYEPVASMAEALEALEKNDKEALERIIIKKTDHLSVLATGADAMLAEAPAPEGLEKLVDSLMVTYPVIVADLSHSDPLMKKTLVGRASQINVVSTASLPALRLARTLMNEIKDARGGNDDGVEFILNKTGKSPATEANEKDVSEAIGKSVSANISFQPKLFMGAESEGRFVCDEKAGQDILYPTLLPLLQKVLGRKGSVDIGASKKAGIVDALSGLLKKG